MTEHDQVTLESVENTLPKTLENKENSQYDDSYSHTENITLLNSMQDTTRLLTAPRVESLTAVDKPSTANTKDNTFCHVSHLPPEQ